MVNEEMENQAAKTGIIRLDTQVHLSLSQASLA